MSFGKRFSRVNITYGQQDFALFVLRIALHISTPHIVALHGYAHAIWSRMLYEQTLR